MVIKLKKKIENKKMFASKSQMIIYICLYVLILAGFIVLGNINFGDELTDNERFVIDYEGFTEENAFKYTTPKDLIGHTKNNAVIFFGSPRAEWTYKLAEIVNDVALELEFDNILYYDYLDDRINNNGNYELLVDELVDTLKTNDRGVTEIYGPAVLVIIDGKTYFFDDSTAFTTDGLTPEIYWSDYRVGEFYSMFKTVLETYMVETNG